MFIFQGYNSVHVRIYTSTQNVPIAYTRVAVLTHERLLIIKPTGGTKRQDSAKSLCVLNCTCGRSTWKTQHIGLMIQSRCNMSCMLHVHTTHFRTLHCVQCTVPWMGTVLNNEHSLKKEQQIKTNTLVNRGQQQPQEEHIPPSLSLSLLSPQSNCSRVEPSFLRLWLKRTLPFPGYHNYVIQ